MNPAPYYRSRRVLVIGGLGYLGSNLAAALLDAGAEVTIVTPARDRHPLAAGRFEAAGARVVDGDIRHIAAMRDAVRSQDVVFNVSGQSGAVQSVHDPIVDLDVNCAGNLALLEALRLESPRAKLVFAGSRLVYGAARTLPVTEDHAIVPLCPHGAHKAMVEQYLAMYGALHGVRATTLRITNPYGPGQPSERRAYGVINYLIHRALAGQSLPIYGDGAQIRDYVFIGDVVAAMLLVGADAGSDGRIYNIGSGVGIRMVDAARLIIATAGAGRIEMEPWPPLVREIDTGDFVANIARAGSELGWRPATAFADGLRETVAASIAQGANP
jgi:UDP-glucose 4-epimerase